MEPKFQVPTETVDLPSKGLLYPEDSPLASGTIEMKYMTAKEEDILTNSNYIQRGVVIDKLLQSLVVTKGFNYQELLSGDKNAIMIAARILSYGAEYQVEIKGQDVKIDLTELQEKEVDLSLFTERKNEFTFKLPHTDNVVTYKLLTHADEVAIEREIKGLQKVNKDNLTTSTTRLKYMLVSVNGLSEKKDIREFVDNHFLAKDARALREEYTKVNPDIDLTVYPNGVEEGVDLPINLNFFWPDARI